MIYKLAKDLISGQTKSVNKIDDNGQIYGIPFDPANTDYQAYLKFLEDGGTPLPADE